MILLPLLTELAINFGITPRDILRPIGYSTKKAQRIFLIVLSDMYGIEWTMQFAGLKTKQSFKKILNNQELAQTAERYKYMYLDDLSYAQL